jgi:hypothetical protein
VEDIDIKLVHEGRSKKAGGRRNKAEKTGFSLILNGWFIYAVLY